MLQTHPLLDLNLPSGSIWDAEAAGEGVSNSL